MKNIFPGILGTVLILLLSAGEAHAVVMNTNVYGPANYTTFLPPALGGSYTDAIFGTSIKRISSAALQRNAETGLPFSFITHEYSTMSPFNMDNSRILLLHQSYFALYDAAGNYIKDCSLLVHASSEPRWSRTDPNVLYFINGNQLKQYNAATDAVSVVHTFNEYSTISGKGESDISFDGDHFVLVGDNRYIFVFEVSTKSKGGALDSAGRGFDSVYITPNNNVTVTWFPAGTVRYTGIEFFDRNMNFQRQVSRAGGHMDVGRDVNGDEVLLLINSADPTPIANNAIVKIRLSDGHQTALISLDWNLAVHVSAPDNNGWVFIETYAPSDPMPGGAGWVTYTNELLQIKLDGTEIRRLAHHRSRPLNSYNYGPRVSVSRDGSKLIYSSNFGLQNILGYTTEYSDVYMISLSSGTPSTVTLSSAPMTVSAGGSIIATWANIANPTATDWLALYASSSAPNSPPIAWRYTNGFASGSLPIVIPQNVGSGTTYQLRLWSNNVYTRLATSNSFTIQATTQATLTVNPNPVSAGGTVTATWANIANPTTLDWLALYASAGAPNSPPIAWRYTNGLSSGFVPFVIPANAALGSTYQLRLWSNNGYTRLATSNSFTVQGATLTVTPVPVSRGGTVNAIWTSITSPTANDWIGLYATSGAAPNACVSYRYTNGQASSSVPFTIPAGAAPGTTYELRLYSNSSYTRLATSSPFTVQ